MSLPRWTVYPALMLIAVLVFGAIPRRASPDPYAGGAGGPAKSVVVLGVDGMDPEILVGYHRGFRHSWDCATGSVSREVFTDNTKSWSGDHCVDPRLVPGVFWCNRKISVADPNLLDIAPTALDLFGVEAPRYMQGRRLFEGATTPSTDRGAKRPELVATK